VESRSQWWARKCHNSPAVTRLSMWTRSDTRRGGKWRCLESKTGLLQQRPTKWSSERREHQKFGAKIDRLWARRRQKTLSSASKHCRIRCEGRRGSANRKRRRAPFWREETKP
jgi:hypothetical protein